LRSALLYVQPTAASVQPHILFMSQVQDALMPSRRDVVLAATYLGIVAHWEMSSDLIDEIARALCIPIASKEAAEIAALSNDIRHHLRNSQL
jgi:hypothetical protein